MSCEDIQESLSLYCDDGLEPEARAICYQHLEMCPVCREHLVELRSIRRGLANLPRPSLPADLVPAITDALIAEAAARDDRRDVTFADVISELLWPRVTRYAFSSVASLLLFASVFLALRPQLIALNEAVRAFDATMTTSESIDPSFARYDINRPISPESYSALRAPFNAESPSLNPGGALASLGRSPAQTIKGKRQDSDDMMVVADVFSNGAASLADVMQAPRDRRMLDDFQKALRQDAAFVPAELDRRPGTMRVVYSVHRVDVHDRNY
ncbi:MAG TPA: zf-HC2 domain-containing protein [Pyrinomonadaceae bacterium]|nr:zf-HC2 domain-containing protein [Pyrinomonadaceae bacterium]